MNNIFDLTTRRDLDIGKCEQKFTQSVTVFQPAFLDLMRSASLMVITKSVFPESTIEKLSHKYFEWRSSK